MIQEELESQLSAMFDGELPATECELLSRRIDRDEVLRARWSRYALIGAAMRSEPVATARSGFARRVSVALRGGELLPRATRGRKMIVNAAVAASLVVGVAGMSISLLRSSAIGTSNGSGMLAQTPAGAIDAAPLAHIATPALSAAPLLATARHASSGEPVSYVTPASAANATTALRTELADFIVAHSEYSTSLMRRNLLSALVSNEDGSDFASPGAGVATAPSSSSAGALHATIAASASSR